MKLDMKLIITLLNECSEPSITVMRHSHETLEYHIWLLVDAGFIVDWEECGEWEHGIPVSISVNMGSYRLTWKGHKKLRNSRSG